MWAFWRAKKKHELVYSPQKDITAHEVALVINSIIGFQSGYSRDSIRKQIERDGISKHFRDESK